MLPIAREVKQPVRTKSRAEAASALDQVKTVRTTNQEASSGKCVWIEWGSRAPAACVDVFMLANPSRTQKRLKRNKRDSITYHESVQNPDRDPKTTPHGIDDCYQRITGLEAIKTCDELCQAAKDPDKRKEDGGRFWAAPPVCDVATCDEGRARESCES